MQYVNNILDFISSNKEWLFSGSGVTALAIVVYFFRRKKKNSSTNIQLNMKFELPNENNKHSVKKPPNSTNSITEHQNKSDDERISILEKRVEKIELEKMQDFIIRYNHIEQKLIKDKHTCDIIMAFESENGIITSIPYLNDFYKRLSIPEIWDWWLKLSQQEKKDNFKVMVNEVKGKYGEKYAKQLAGLTIDRSPL